MSDFSSLSQGRNRDSNLISEIAEGAAALDSARVAQSLSGIRFIGSAWVEERALKRAMALMMSDKIINALLDGNVRDESVLNLVERYLELKRRRHLPVEVCLWEARILITELVANSHHLQMKYNKIIGATILNRELVADIPYEPEFSDLSESQFGLIRKIVNHYPENPRRALRLYIRKCAELLASSEFSDFHETPGIIRLAVSRNSLDPEGFLKLVRRLGEVLMADPEVVALNYSKAEIRNIVARGPRVAREKLMQAAEEGSEILKEDEFRYLKDKPQFVRSVCLRYADPRATLRKVKRFEEKFCADSRFSVFPDSIIREIIFGYLANPEKELLIRLSQYRSIVDDPRFAAYRDTPSVVLTALRQKIRTPQNYLLELEELSSQIQAQPEFADISPTLIRRACVSHASDPRAALRKTLGYFREYKDLEEFETLENHRFDLLRTILFNLDSPLAALRHCRDEARRLERLPEFSEFQPYAQFIRTIVFKRPRGAEEYLRYIKTTTDIILSEPEFESFSARRHVVHCCVTFHRGDPRKALRNRLLGLPPPLEEPLTE